MPQSHKKTGYFRQILHILIITFIFILPLPSSASSSRQLILIRTPTISAFRGTLQRYQRRNLHAPWKAIGKPWPVVIGKKGMTWKKQEGDERTPAGIFYLGPQFGFDRHPRYSVQMEYLPLAATSVCVDDSRSRYYNQLLDSALISYPDWHSSEAMKKISLYQQGAVVQYNMSQPINGAGSCIFLHIWRRPDQGTAGCIAMERSSLAELLAWLDAKQKPRIAIFPEGVKD